MKRNNSISLFVFELSLLLPILKEFLSVFFNQYIYLGLTAVLYSALVITIIINWNIFLVRLSVYDLLFWGVIICAFIFAPFHDQFNSSIYKNSLSDLFKTCLIGYIATRFVAIDGQLSSRLRFVSYSCLVMNLLGVLLHPHIGGRYSMNDGYNFLYGYALLCIVVSQEDNYWDNFMSYLFIGLIIFCGTRGPLLIALLLFLTTRVLSGFSLRRLFSDIVFFLVLIVGLLLLDAIIGLFGSVYEEFFSVRLFDDFSLTMLFDSPSRVNIYSSSFDYALSHVLIGTGVTTDRVVVASLLGVDAGVGTYSHNLFIEWLLQFGLLGGVFSILAFVAVSISSYSICRMTRFLRAMFISLFAIGVLHLMISSSYLQSFGFFAYVGFMLNVNESFKYAPESLAVS